ncbi:MAG: hypothetical protein ACSHXZ_10755 [Gammaproteobacteria bacterium]
MEEIVNSGGITLSLLTLLSLGINVLTIYRWIADHLNKESQNDQAFHMLIGLANSVNKRTLMIAQRMKALKSQDRGNADGMVFLENMWSDQMSTVDNLLASAKALKPKEASKLPYDSLELLKISAGKFNAGEPK